MVLVYVPVWVTVRVKVAVLTGVFVSLGTWDSVLETVTDGDMSAVAVAEDEAVAVAVRV